MSLAVVLSLEAVHEASLVFSVVFIVIWAGSAVVTINAQLLGAALSFFQTLCILGYCIFPLLLAASVNLFWRLLGDDRVRAVLSLLLVILCCGWSMRAVSAYLQDSTIPENRKSLVLFPVLLFYISLSWMVLIGSTASLTVQHYRTTP
mmetsp:Transcript_9726/g.17544  ORF Transcript_9726/g.17544 Transcript_9726/m.17544 type:complete len:148 (+) Transcript_9726:413-856(+)